MTLLVASVTLSAPIRDHVVPTPKTRGLAVLTPEGVLDAPMITDVPA